MNEHSDLTGIPTPDTPESLELRSEGSNSASESDSSGQNPAVEAIAEPSAEVPSAIPAQKSIPRADAGDWMSGIQWLCSTIVLAVFVITFLAQAFQIPSES